MCRIRVEETEVVENLNHDYIHEIRAVSGRGLATHSE
jgi:hypothetical protein